MRYVAAEGGRFPFDFDQRLIGAEGQRVFADEFPIGETVQALLVATGRNRRVKIPAGTPKTPKLKQRRQSRITAAVAGPHPKFAYRPAKYDYPDIGVRFDRKEAAGSLAGRGMDSRPSMATAGKQKTTAPLSGLEELGPTHRLIDLRAPFGTVAVALCAGPSEFKLGILTNSNGGLAFESSRRRYRDPSIALRREPTTLAPSPDPYPEIPF